MEILKILNGYCTEEDFKNAGVFISFQWEEILPEIKQIIRLREDEIIDGFICTEAGLKIKLSRKKGRKTNGIHKNISNAT